MSLVSVSTNAHYTEGRGCFELYRDSGGTVVFILCDKTDVHTRITVFMDDELLAEIEQAIARFKRLESDALIDERGDE